jgi:hypothetical protein
MRTRWRALAVAEGKTRKQVRAIARWRRWSGLNHHGRIVQSREYLDFLESLDTVYSEEPIGITS